MTRMNGKRLAWLLCVFCSAQWLAGCATPATVREATAGRTASVASSRTIPAGTLAMKSLLTSSPSVEPEMVPPTETPLPLPISPLPDGCVDSSLVTLKDLGQTMCVGGAVFSATKTHGDMYIAFGSDQSAFYLVGYDWNSPAGFNPGDCIYTHGTVQSIGSVPMMKVERAGIHACLPPSYDTPTPPGTLPSGCRFALDFQLTDYGKLMCAGGVVAYVAAHDDNRDIYFSLVLSQGVHFVVHGMAKGDREVHAGECVYSASRRVDKTGRVLVMLLSPADIQRCR
jgi:hypothetical protein